MNITLLVHTVGKKNSGSGLPNLHVVKLYPAPLIDHFKLSLSDNILSVQIEIHQSSMEVELCATPTLCGVQIIARLDELRLLRKQASSHRQ